MAAPGLQLVYDRDVVAANSTSSSSDAAFPQEPSFQISAEPTPSSTPADVDLEQLYPASAELNTQLSQGLILLAQCLQRAERAINYVRTQQLVSADDQAHHMLTLLDELFCLRRISEGFANVVAACGNGLRNLRGQLPSEEHLLALNSCLLAIKKKPFLDFDASVELIERLEAVDLNVDAAGTNEILDWLGDEGAN